MIKKLNQLLVFFALSSISLVKGGVILYEGFDYDAGSLATQNGGYGFSTAWANSGPGGDVVAYPGKTYSSESNELLVDGGFTSISSTGTTGAYRDYSAISAPDGSTTYWISVIASTGGTPFGASGDEASIQFRGAGNNNFVTIGAFGVSSSWRIRAKSADGSISELSSATGVPDSSTEAFLLIRIDVDTATDAADNLYFWVDPGLTDEPTIASSAGSITGVNLWDSGDFEINRIRSGLNNGGAADAKSFMFDELRFGETFGDVTPTIIPEFSTYSLILGIFLCVWVFFGRSMRRSK